MGGNRCFLPEASTHLNFWIPPYVWVSCGQGTNLREPQFAAL